MEPDIYWFIEDDCGLSLNFTDPSLYGSQSPDTALLTRFEYLKGISLAKFINTSPV